MHKPSSPVVVRTEMCRNGNSPCFESSNWTQNSEQGFFKRLLSLDDRAQLYAATKELKKDQREKWIPK